MRNKPPIFYVLIVIAFVLAGALLVQFGRDAVYFYRLQALSRDTQVITAQLLIPESYVIDISRKDVRAIDYVFEIDETQYRGVAQDNGQSTNQIAVRYVTSDPSINLPANLDIGTERGFTLLRLIVLAGFVAVAVVVFVVFRRR